MIGSRKFQMPRTFFAFLEIFYWQFHTIRGILFVRYGKSSLILVVRLIL